MKTLGYGLIVSSILATALYATSPAWWKERGVMPSDYDEKSLTAIEENYEAAKVGQLMNMATKAAEELNANLKDGAGDEINNLISSFKEFDVENPDKNYQALTTNDLKYVASLFYKRLSELPKTYVSMPEEPAFSLEESNSDKVTNNSEISQSTLSLPARTSTNKSTTEETIANVGQLKNSFAWSLTSVANDDNDADGLPDSWEMKYFGNLTTANGTSCYNGDGVSDLQKYQQGKDPTLPPENSNLYLVVYTPLE